MPELVARALTPEEILQRVSSMINRRLLQRAIDGRLDYCTESRRFQIAFRMSLDLNFRLLFMNRPKMSSYSPSRDPYERSARILPDGERGEWHED
ncbi:uncharacterized protein ARMOST_04349 [Armillaria ostoyae]|uniref:Uncharacterized protein n=1 Tax=Armillaria ostoyae TaxID=47428 RepID=A0A284QX43_ARMOS|nr:uncharacterized protein ARMOST_04349 [Armillaria ostoyae]